MRLSLDIDIPGAVNFPKVQNHPRPRLRSFACCVGILGALSAAASAQTLTKLYDFSSTLGTPMNPYDTPIVIGNELWFTTQSGGTTGFGTIAKFNTSTSTLTTVLNTMDTLTGNTPTSSLTQVGNYLYYTTTRGGTGDTGTLSMYDMVQGKNTVLYNFGFETNDPRTPSGGVTAIDRGAGGLDLYYMTTNGGTGGAAFGTISKYNTLTGNTTVVYNFTGDGSSRQPFEGFTKVGNDLYFTTFTGGLTSSSPTANNGVGTLAKLDTTTDTFTFLKSLPTGDGSTFFPSHNPTYDPATNALYFTTNGSATQPGSLQKFDITTGVLSTLYELTGAATSSGPFPDGRFATGPVTVLGDELYFTTTQGGASGGGTINRFDLSSNTFIKLFDLNSDTGNNYGGETRGGFAVIDDGVTTHLYLTPRQGGIADKGTILRLDLASVPEPTAGVLALAGVGTLLGRRRRRTL